MKIVQDIEYAPISITLETKEEASRFIRLFDQLKGSSDEDREFILKVSSWFSRNGVRA